MTDTVVYLGDAPQTIILNDDAGTVIVGNPDNTTVVLGTDDTIIIGPDVPGPPGSDGAQGPPGPSGGATFTRTAAIALSGHRVVKTVGSNKVNYASNDQSADALLIEGITTGAADANADIFVQDSGDMVEGSWNWNLGPVFCGTNGTLTQNPPAGVWLRQVAVAIATDTIIVGLQPSIFTP